MPLSFLLEYSHIELSNLLLATFRFLFAKIRLGTDTYTTGNNFYKRVSRRKGQLGPSLSH